MNDDQAQAVAEAFRRYDAAREAVERISVAADKALAWCKKRGRHNEVSKVIGLNAQFAIFAAVDRHLGLQIGDPRKAFADSISKEDPRRKAQRPIDEVRTIAAALVYVKELYHPDAGSTEIPIEKTRFTVAEMKFGGALVTPDAVKKSITRARKSAREEHFFDSGLGLFRFRARLYAAIATLPN